MRICVDLNVWVADQLAIANGRRAGSATQVIQAVGAMRAGDVRLQLIVSMQMLDNLRTVLIERLDAGPSQAIAFVEAIEAMVRNGPEQLDPYMIVSGAEKYAIADREDREVLATAIAGRASLLVTSNLRHFRTKECETIDTQTVAGKAPRKLHVQIHQIEGRSLIVADPIDVAGWFSLGTPMEPAALRAHYAPPTTHGVS
jgi:predicted nucleic acid-binding protein